MLRSRRCGRSGQFWGLALPLVVLLLGLTGCRAEQAALRPQQASDENYWLTVRYVDPLIKVLRGAAIFPEQEARADVARGEHATLQFVVRSNEPITGLQASIREVRAGAARLDSARVGYVGYVRVGRIPPNPATDRIDAPSGYYPDPILREPPAVVPPATSQPIWITVPIPEDARPGTYRGAVTVTGRAGSEHFSVRRDVTIRVYPPVVDETRLWVTNWYSLDANQLRYMNGGAPVTPYSERYWELARVIAEKMAAYRQNVALISPLELTQYTVEAGRYQFDFSRFDRMVRLFIDAGVVGRIEGGHLGTRSGNWTSAFEVYVPDVRADTTVFETRPITDEAARSFYRQFIPALMSQLETKGWTDQYMQHIADEPIEANADSYVQIARFIKDLAPDLPIIDALHFGALQGTVDVWVPELDFLDQDYDFYKKLQQADNEVWFYTCLAPQGEYANRFIALPLIKTRLLHWINFRYDIPGYLHWGFNWWRGDPYEETTGIILESGNVLPGGDAWIVYPTEGRLLSSIRLEAMRDGIVDYELLMMLEARRPKLARELAQHVVYGFAHYDTNVAAFRAKRRRILQALSKSPIPASGGK